MATVCLNKEALQSNGLSPGEALLMLAIHNKADLKQAEKLLIQKGFITADRDSSFQIIGWRLTRMGTSILEGALADSVQPDKQGDNLDELALKLKEIYPKGRKDGTNNYWTEGQALIVRRLKLFFKKYGTEYSHEQIIQATQDYVNSFNGDYRFMRVLKYFIFKEVKGANGEIEGTSDLLNRLDNAGQEDTENNNWMNIVR